MVRELVTIISTELKSLEQGKFQAFCVDFLPLVDKTYEGLKRHGGTANGKTRKGTPDLIKTDADGKQIGAQCSVAKNYWRIPKEKITLSKCKPCKDIDSCLEKLSSLNEIVLCSNQEIPVDVPNAESQIRAYAKERSNVKITLFSCADIEKLLAENTENPKFNILFKTYLPWTYEQVKLLRESQKNKLAISLLQEQPISFTDALKIAEEAANKFINVEEAKAYAVERTAELKSRFERDDLPDPRNVIRQLGEDFPLKHPKGSIYCLLGVPKIGKTTVVAQCAVHWKSQGSIIHWFDCPIAEYDAKALVKDVSRSLWASFLSPEEANQLADGILNLESINVGRLEYNPSWPTIYIIDNAELLLLFKEPLMSLCATLTKLKSSNLFANIGFIFISNICMKHVFPAISHEFPVPAWSQGELKEFLLARLKESAYYLDDSFLRSLVMKSGGHPLIALALAKRFPSVEKLLLSTIMSPSLADEDLTAEVKKLLFDDILANDTDCLNYVLRLSVLTSRADDSIIHVIKTKIDPVISKPFDLALEKLHGTVIEGDTRSGYSISFVYREVARYILDIEDQRLILDVVSTELLTPVGKVLDADKVTTGVFYALLADKCERAFYWTIILLQSAINSNLLRVQLRAIIERLELFGIIRVPDEPKLLLMYYSMSYLMASIYSQIGSDDKAFELLDRIKDSSIQCDDEMLIESIRDLIDVASVYKTTIIAVKSPKQAMALLSRTEFNRIRKSPFLAQSVRMFLKVLFAKVPIKYIPNGFVSKVIDSIDSNDESDVSSLIHMSTDLAAKCNSEGAKPKEVISLLSANNEIVEVLHAAFNAQLALDTKEPRKALDFIQQSIELLQKKYIWGKTIENILRLLQGDAYYSLKENDKAMGSYLRCIECCGDDVSSFEYAWANFRIGLLSDNAAEAQEFYKQSSLAFMSCEYDDLYSRSEGERTVVLMQMGQPLEFVRIADSLLRGYYIEKKDKYGPTVTIMIAHLERLKCMIENKPLPKDEKKDEENIFPEFDKGIYSSVLNAAKPRAEAILAFYILGECYLLLNHKDYATNAFRTALSISPDTQLGKECAPIVIRALLDMVVPEGARDEIKKLITNCLFINLDQIALPSGSDKRTYISNCALSKVDSAIAELNEEQQEKFIGLLSEIRKALLISALEHAGWWLSELDCRLARIGERFYKQERERSDTWKRAFESALQVDNHRIIIEAGYRLGFDYYKLFRIKDLADVQFSVLKSISAINTDFTHVEKIGQDMFKFWQYVEWRKLYDSDSKAKQALLDGAKALKNVGLLPQDAGPIMILLISSINQYRDNVTDWAVSKIEETGSRSKIPNELMKRIDLYFH